MLISGHWDVLDGSVRPVIHGEAQAATGAWIPVPFLIDSGADCSVFSAPVRSYLALPESTAGELLGGVGGLASSVLVETGIRLLRHDGNTVLFKGRFAAFTDPEALDISVLGRDITNLFALILDRPGDSIALVSQSHRYRIEELP